MYKFVFTHDAHVTEPEDLLQQNLPRKFHADMLRVVHEGGGVLYKSGDKLLFQLKSKGDISRAANVEQIIPGTFPGCHDIAFRWREMETSGVDSSIIYSSLISFAYALAPKPGIAHMQVFNDWCIDHFKGFTNTFVPNAMLPAYDPRTTLDEFMRVLSLGYRSVMLPINPPDDMPRYSDHIWDPIWSMCEETNIPMTMHSGTASRPFATMATARPA